MKHKNYLALLLFLLIVFQLSDYLFFNSVSVEVNNKLIFGYFGGNFLAVLTAITVLVLLYFIIPKTKTGLFLFCLISASAISNIIDRLIYGGVVDYIKFWFIPTFNLADIAIVFSIIVIFLQIIKKQERTANNTDG